MRVCSRKQAWIVFKKKNPSFTIKVSAGSDVVKKPAGFRTGRIPEKTRKTVSRSGTKPDY